MPGPAILNERPLNTAGSPTFEGMSSPRLIDIMPAELASCTPGDWTDASSCTPFSTHHPSNNHYYSHTNNCTNYSFGKKHNVLCKPHRSTEQCWSLFLSPQPDTSLHCKTTDTKLVHRVVCLFNVPAVTSTKLSRLVTGYTGTNNFAQRFPDQESSSWPDFFMVSLTPYHCATMALIKTLKITKKTMSKVEQCMADKISTIH